MFRKAYRLPFTLLGIPVLLDVTFLVILPVMALSIAGQVGYWARQVGVEDHPSLHKPWVPYALGLATALGLFVSVILHELGHSAVARWYGVKVRSITLWLLGGMAQFDEMPRQRGAEAVMAIAGPVVSVVVGVVCALLLRSLPPSAVPAAFVLGSLARMNILLALFNMIPALPLDGGRVLRSLLALRTTHLRATQVAAGVSKFLAIALGLFGLWSGQWMLILIAFFVYVAVNSELRGSMVTELLDGARVGELMTRRVTPVTADLTVAELAQAMMREHVQGFPVVDAGGRVVGMVCIEDLQGRPLQPDARVADVMRPQVFAIRPEAPAVEAMQRMSSNNYPRLLVVDTSGQVVGVLTNTDLLRAIEMRTMGLRWGVPAPDGNGTPAQVAMPRGGDDPGTFRPA
jgi:Zn-dependent protease/predicted transcriptional regulator